MPGLFSLDTGTLGLEAVHTWSADNIADLDLNDRASDDVIAVTRITGLHDLPDIVEPGGVPRPGQPGESAYPTSLSSKTVVYEGFLRSATLPGLRALSSALRASFTGVASSGVMDITPNAALGGPAGRFYARALSLITDDVQAQQYWRREYQLSLRLSDPRVYFPSLAVSETGSSSVSVTNDGTAPADPVITVTGCSGNDVTITDGTHLLTFKTVTGSLVVDFAARSALVGTTPQQLDMAVSSWWDSFVDGIAPGASVTVAQTNGTGINVSFTPSVW